MLAARPAQRLAHQGPGRHLLEGLHDLLVAELHSVSGFAVDLDQAIPRRMGCSGFCKCLVSMAVWPRDIVHPFTSSLRRRDECMSGRRLHDKSVLERKPYIGIHTSREAGALPRICEQPRRSDNYALSVTHSVDACKEGQWHPSFLLFRGPLYFFSHVFITGHFCNITKVFWYTLRSYSLVKWDFSYLEGLGGLLLKMTTERDLGIGVTIDVENVSLPKKYMVAALLAVAICEHFPSAFDLLDCHNARHWGRPSPRNRCDLAIHCPRGSGTTGIEGWGRRKPKNQERGEPLGYALLSSILDCARPLSMADSLQCRE